MSESTHFAELLREGLAQHLTGTLLSAHALALRLKRSESSEVLEAGQLVELLHAAIDDLTELITKLQSGQLSEATSSPSSRTDSNIARILHDKVAQEAATAILTAGLLALNLQREGHARANEAEEVTKRLKKMGDGVNEAMHLLTP